MGPQWKTIGFGSRRRVNKSENHANKGFSGSPEMKSKNHESKKKQNNSMELPGHFFSKHAVKMAPRPSDPTSGFFFLEAEQHTGPPRLATGPPRLATRPPRSGAVVGVGMLRARGTT